MKTQTTSVRLPIEMSEQLNKAALMLHHGKNWIIVQAIRHYLAHLKPLSLMEEIKRQSLLASSCSCEEDNLLEDNWDTVCFANTTSTINSNKLR